MNFIDFSNKTALITGAGSGIGQATAVLFAELGCKKILLIGRNIQKLQDTKEKILSKTPSCIVECDSVDLADPKNIASFIKKSLGTLESLDFLVNNAGVFVGDSLEKTSSDSSAQQMQVNFAAPLSLVQGFLPLLKNSLNACVVNVSSTLAVKPIADAVVYNASKAALSQMSRSLALELAPHKVRVNAVLPAVVDTEMFSNRFDSEAEKQAGYEFMKKIHPLGRVGQPQDIAHAIAFLCSERASWVTGVCLPVDGGMLCT